MPAIDYSHMTVAEKLDLIGEIWNSIEPEDVPLTDEQAAEIDRRIAMLESTEEGHDAVEVLD